MSIDPSSQLLQRLAHPRVGVSGSTGVAPNRAGETSSWNDFASLLKSAQDGTLRSSLPVTIASDAGVSLSDEQLARLSLATDKAEAAGVKKALVVVGGQQLTLDVQTRTITGHAHATDGVLPGVDGVIDLDAVAQQASAAVALGVPSGFASNSSLQTLLARSADKTPLQRSA